LRWTRTSCCGAPARACIFQRRSCARCPKSALTRRRSLLSPSNRPSQVFKFGRLDSWFFTAVARRKEQLPRIKRKRDYTVRRGDIVKTIIDSFCAQAASDNDLVATWISGIPNENCRVLHLTKKSLPQFLAFIKHAQKGHGVLQRWCAPFGGHSTMLRTEWSPHFFSLEMCTNWHSVRTLARVRTPTCAACRPARTFGDPTHAPTVTAHDTAHDARRRRAALFLCCAAAGERLTNADCAAPRNLRGQLPTRHDDWRRQRELTFQG
jgi:hypothetical protein